MKFSLHCSTPALMTNLRKKYHIYKATTISESLVILVMFTSWPFKLKRTKFNRTATLQIKNAFVYDFVQTLCDSVKLY